MTGHEGAGTVAITLHDPSDDNDDTIDRLVDFGNEQRAESMPGDPPMPYDVGRRQHRAVPAKYRRWSYRATEPSGRIVGAAEWTLDPDDKNPDLMRSTVRVVADHRGRGVGGRLLAELVALADHRGHRRLHGFASEQVPAGAAFATNLGGAEKLREHVNHLPLDDVDRPMLERWVAEATDRSRGYELVAFDGRCPDDIAAAFASLVNVMNTAPRDDLGVNDWEFTLTHLREHEDQVAAAGSEAWTLVARHRESGALAGFHDVYHSAHDTPEVVWVGATGVQPEHRGHALGKWLKATMTLRVLDERPGATHIRTENADSNDPMLGINRLMGYRPLRAGAIWEVSVDDARAWLAGRGIQAQLDPATLHG